MKKLVLVLISTLLLAVFIALNYLLWEREAREEKLRQMESSNASNNTTLNSLNRDIKKLEEDNSKLSTELDQMKSLNITLQSDNQLLKEDKLKAISEVNTLTALIDVLLHRSELTAFEDVVNKWSEAISSQKYEDAYKLEHGWKNPEEIKISIEDYSALYKDKVKTITLKSLTVDDNRIRTPKGQLGFIAVLEVELAEDAAPTALSLSEGENKKLFRFIYLNDEDGFVIESIINIQ